MTAFDRRSSDPDHLPLRLAAGLAGLLILASCGGLAGGTESAGSEPTSTESPKPDPTATWEGADLTRVLPTEAAPALWVSPDLPSAFLAKIHIPAGWSSVPSRDLASVRVEAGEGRVISTWIYALAAPFPTVTDGITGDQFRQAWAGAAPAPFTGRPLMMENATLDMLGSVFGPPGPGAVKVLPADQLPAAAWADRPAWAVIPFEALEPHWKVLAIDGLSPLSNGFTPEDYPLAIPISAAGDASASKEIDGAVPATNRDPSKFTTVMMTGVTAMVRGTAWLMEQNGIFYPAGEIGDVLRSADVTHVSNEIPFSQGCPFPDPGPGSLLFCSDPRYIDLLEFIGTDVVELTGNHVRDWGIPALEFTLSLYRERGWLYFGGGENLADAQKPALMVRNGNRLAFIGCNPAGPEEAWATETDPGAAPCDFAYLAGEIRGLRDQGYLPIMTFQYFEYYHFEPTAEQTADFQKMADAGAVIVSGSQGHYPQAFAFDGNSLIHYGLGNLFFDQYYWMDATRNATLDRHVFYDGYYIGTDLLTITFTDNARPRWMTPVERSAFLEALFVSSGWANQ